MNEYKMELEYFEERYEKALEGIIKEFKKEFEYYSINSMKEIDKEELNNIIQNEDFYFANSLNLPEQRNNRLINMLLDARKAYERKEDMRKRISYERKKDYQKIMTKEEYTRKYENKKRRQKRRKLQRTIVMGGLIVAVGLGSIIGVSAEKEKNLNLNSNVCVQYTVQDGDTYKDIERLGIRDWGFGSYEVSGAYRDSEFVYAGDVVIGRTTKENADYLVKQGLCEIITLEEALEMLGETHTLIGEFKKAADGNSNITFFIPTTKIM